MSLEPAGQGATRADMMNTQTTYPLVVAVEPLTAKRLRVSFSNGSAKLYDCAPLLALERFRLLAGEAFFRAVRPDPGGYGIVWNDGIDLAESELWINGKEAETAVGRELRDGWH